MLNHEDRMKAALYEEWSVALSRTFEVKFRLRRERAARIKRTKKREPHVGNKRPIYVAHVDHQNHCLDRFMDALGISRSDAYGLDSALSKVPVPEWFLRGRDGANRRIKEDRQAGVCGCHLCAARSLARQREKWT